MNKKEAVQYFVDTRLKGVPQDWVRTICESKGEYHVFPIWGTMWFIDDDWGRILMENARIMQECDDEKSQRWNERNANEEMIGEYAVVDVHGDTTNIFIYEIDDRFLIGVNGAGYDFYDGVWDVLYDTLGLLWHKEEPVI